jgi:hypothetical protein
MKKFIERDGSYFVRAEDVVVGMKLDFEGDSIADPNGNGTHDDGHYEAFEFEFAVVNEITREGPTASSCIRHRAIMASRQIMRSRRRWTSHRLRPASSTASTTTVTT